MNLPRVSSPALAFSKPIELSRTAILALVVSVALPIRLVGLGASGFSEDEINKWNAIHSYSAGDFSANGEHPMLMKLAVWASVSAGRAWNARLPAGAALAIPPEAALRLPNAVAGAATAAVLFLLGEALFGTAIGAWAGGLWALDVNAAAINRIGKEDTFLVFFLLLGAYLYERGPRFFNRSGGAFGLMLASKYMPHFFGLHALFAFAANPRRRLSAPARRPSFYVAMGAAFFAANVAVLLPSTWRYVLGYAGGSAVKHTGYMFAGALHVNAMETSPWGLPPWFYVTYLAAKVPLVVLAASAAGIAWVWRHPGERGAVFIRIFLVLTLLPYSLVSGKFVRYMLPVLAVLDLAAAVGIVTLLRRTAAPALAGATVVALLAVNVAASAPHYALARNAIGAMLGPPGSLFPDDEFYDAGVREAVQAVSRVAPAGSVICSDAPAVVRAYLNAADRRDVTSCSLSRDGVPMRPVDTWIIQQDGHVYFENAATLEAIRRRMAPAAEFRAGDAVAARLYHFRGSRS
jgi:hypothetical protein